LDGIHAYSRRRTLVPFKIELDKNKDKSEIFGLILIRLKMRSLRLVFLSWLTGVLKDSDIEKDSLYNSFLDIYMSNGWEDFVFLIDGKNPSVSEIFETIRYLGDNPLVEKTETIFAKSVLEKENENLNFDFLIKVSYGDEFIKDFKGFKEKHDKKNQIITLTQLNGEMDLRISLIGEENLDLRDEIFKYLNKNKNVRKVLTHVGFHHLSPENVINSKKP